MAAPLGGNSGAGNESRTRDLNLGKVALYQLSYSRGGTADYIGTVSAVKAADVPIHTHAYPPGQRSGDPPA